VRGALTACILNDTRVDRHHGCDRVMGAIERLLDANGFRVTGLSPAHADWRSDSGFLRALDSAQLVVVNGEGTLHDDRPAARTLLQVGPYARSRNIPAVLVNAGWERNGEELAGLARDFTRVCARDHASAAALRAQGVECRVVPDLSLYGAVGSTASRGADGPIAFTDSVDRWKSIELERCRREVGGLPLSIAYPARGVSGYVRYVRAGFAARDALRPAALVRMVCQRHRFWKAASDSIADFLEALARSRMLVSGRFHACTLALLTGTPFATVPSNTGKIASLVADAGLEPWRTRIELTPRSVVEASRRGWGEHERHSIREYLASAQRLADELFRDIRALT